MYRNIITHLFSAVLSTLVGLEDDIITSRHGSSQASHLGMYSRLGTNFRMIFPTSGHFYEETGIPGIIFDLCNCLLD